jgi:hypothetical protein
MVHDGFMFTVSGKQTGLADAGVFDTLIKVPAATFPHITIYRFSFGRGDIDLLAYEGTTVSADGTAVTASNMNRNSTNTPDTDFFHTPTVTSPGTLMYTLWTPPTTAGIGGSAEGVTDIEHGTEWVLKPSTNYLIRMTNSSGATIDHAFHVIWYEIDATP